MEQDLNELLGESTEPYIAPPLPVVIYHSPCFDGTAAAWVVWNYLEGMVDLVPCGYDYKGLDGIGFIGRDVYIVDFSLPPTTLECLCLDANHVTLIDHHIGAKEKLIDSEWEQPSNLTLLFNMDQSGCQLTWNFLYPGKELPTLLRHIADRDLWEFKLSQTKAIMARVGSYPWQTIEQMDELVGWVQNDPQAFAEGGHLLLDKENEEIATVLKGLRWHLVGGFTVPVLNCPAWLVSEVGNRIMANVNIIAPFVALYHDGNEVRKWSLRSNDAHEDVNKVAAMYGGGGHRNAAGFSTPLNIMFEGV